MTTQNIRVNWHPVSLPSSDLQLYGRVQLDRVDYSTYPSVRQYRRNDEWIAAAVNVDQHPFGQDTVTLPQDNIPQLTSTLIMNAVCNYFANKGFTVEAHRGEAIAAKPKIVPGLLSDITFYHGLTIKPFHLQRSSQVHFGLVLAYHTHQEFTRPIATDPAQLALVKSGVEVWFRNQGGTKVFGRLIELTQDMALVQTRTENVRVSTDKIRLPATYSVLRSYGVPRPRGASTSIVRLLQKESLTLNESGFANTSRLRLQYDKVEDLLGRREISGISVTLPTYCRTVASISLEPSSVSFQTA